MPLRYLQAIAQPLCVISDWSSDSPKKRVDFLWSSVMLAMMYASEHGMWDSRYYLAISSRPAQRCLVNWPAIRMRRRTHVKTLYRRNHRRLAAGRARPTPD